MGGCLDGLDDGPGTLRYESECCWSLEEGLGDGRREGRERVREHPSAHPQNLNRCVRSTFGVQVVDTYGTDECRVEDHVARTVDAPDKGGQARWTQGRGGL